MSAPIKRVKSRPSQTRSRRSGFSLMEILAVLAILALSTALIAPSMSRMLDQATAHAVFFEFQRQVSDLRREANRTGEGIRLIDSGMTPETGDRVVHLRAPWRYTLAPALVIAEGGACAPASANIINGDRIVMTLRVDDASCRFIRYQEAGRTGTTPAGA